MDTQRHKMKIQIDNEVRQATTEEIARIEKMQAESIARKQAEAEAAAEAATARAALLAKLGITEDEAKLLLGGN